MKKIDLDKILDDKPNSFSFLKGAKRVLVKIAIKEAISQALDIASEEAEILDKETGISWTGILDGDSQYEVCKKSILDIKNRIK